MPALFAGIWVALAFSGLLLTYWISVLPLENDLSNSSYRTVATIVIAGTAVVPVLLGDVWWRESALDSAAGEPSHGRNRVDFRERKT